MPGDNKQRLQVARCLARGAPRSNIFMGFKLGIRFELGCGRDLGFSSARRAIQQDFGFSRGFYPLGIILWGFFFWRCKHGDDYNIGFSGGSQEFKISPPHTRF